MTRLQAGQLSAGLPPSFVLCLSSSTFWSTSDENQNLDFPRSIRSDERPLRGIICDSSMVPTHRWKVIWIDEISKNGEKESFTITSIMKITNSKLKFGQFEWRFNAVQWALNHGSQFVCCWWNPWGCWTKSKYSPNELIEICPPNQKGVMTIFRFESFECDFNILNHRVASNPLENHMYNNVNCICVNICIYIYV